MQWVLGVLVALVVLWLVARFVIGGIRRAQDPIYMVDPNDPAMVEATRSAHGSLPYFWERFQNPDADEKNFSVKVKLVDGDRTEHVWLGDLQPVGDLITGKIANTTHVVRNYSGGQEVTVPMAEVADWMFWRDDKVVGNYTMRVQLEKLPPEKQGEMRAMLAENPTISP